jgi:hypothetical protein
VSDQTIAEKTAEPITNPGRAGRSLAHLKAARGFKSLDPNPSAKTPSRVRICPMDVETLWVHESGTGDGARYRQE